METADIISRLSQNAEPVRRLRDPWLRALLWLAIALPSVGLILVAMSPRGDLIERVYEAGFVTEQLAAILTAAAAAAAAFAITVPGRSRGWAALPVAPMIAWLGSIGWSCWTHAGATFTSDWLCLPAIAMIGAIPAIAMVAMLRRGAPLLPRITVALGGLAAAALGDFGLRLFHSTDTGLMVLVWQIGSVAVLMTLAGKAGALFLRWQHTGGQGPPAVSRRK